MNSSHLIDIPDKAQFKIGEVAKILGLKPHVLRFWETEFSQLRPQKTKTNQRIYQRRDVDLLVKIRHLLYDEGFTIAGAKLQLGHDDAGVDAKAMLELIARTRKELLDIIELAEAE